MSNQAQQIDLTSLIAVLNAMSQVLGANGKALTSLLNNGIGAANYTHISGAGTVVAQGTPGRLLTLNINTSGGAGTTATIYDVPNAISLPGTLMVASVSLAVTAPDPITFGPPNIGLKINNGLVIVTTGTADITLGSL